MANVEITGIKTIIIPLVMPGTDNGRMVLKKTCRGLAPKILCCFNQIGIGFLKDIVNRVNHKGQKVIHHPEQQCAFSQRQSEKAKKCHGGQRPDKKIDPHGKNKKHHQQTWPCVFPFCLKYRLQDILLARHNNGGDHGYANRIDENVQGFRMHHKFPEIVKEKPPSSLVKA